MLPGSQQHPHQLVADDRVQAEELAESDCHDVVVDVVPDALRLNDLTELDDLAGESVVGGQRPLLALAAGHGGAVAAALRLTPGHSDH